MDRRHSNPLLHVHRAGLLALAVLTLLLPVSARGLEAIPAYEAVEIGAMILSAYPAAGISSAVAVNEQGDAVGSAIIGGDYQAFLYTAEGGVELLPALPGWSSHQAMDVSDRSAEGLLYIVGTAQNSIYSDPGGAVLWVYDTGASQVIETVDIGVLPGFEASAAFAVNNDVLVVGRSGTSAWIGPQQPMVYDYASDTLYPLDLPFSPVDINDDGQVAGGTGRARLVRDPGTGEITATEVEDLGSPEGTFGGSIASINDLGWVCGYTTMPYTDGAGRFVSGASRFMETWEVLWAVSAFDGASDVNVHGDTVGSLGISGAIRPVLYIESIGELHNVNDLILPPGSGFIDSAIAINDAGWIAGGSGAAVLLMPVGDLPAPTAPTNLTAVPHEPTWQQPWNAITLTWEKSSDLTIDFSVERKAEGTGTWVEIKTNWINTQLWDMDVDLGATYAYRVRARGVAGFSPYSNLASATAPGTPVDAEDPVVEFLSPAEGSQVSGVVPVHVEASDNVGVTYLQVWVYGSLNNGLLCADFDTASLQCDWNTSNLEPGVYRLEAFASDAVGNGGYASVNVQVGADSSVLRSSRIVLRGRVKRGVVSLRGLVRVEDESGNAVRSAIVNATWTYPDGSAAAASAYTDRRGWARFTTTGDRGTYVLDVNDITKSGYAFDPANSVLSATITK